MANVSQENKKEKLAALKKIIPTSWKWSLGVNHHSTLRLNIYSAPVDLVAEWNRVEQKQSRSQYPPFQPAKDHIQVNECYLERQFDNTLPLMQKIKAAMNVGNHDNSDSQTDYFDVGWYVAINIGLWDRPFEVSNEQ